MDIPAALRSLLTATTSSRVTLRQKTPTTLIFPITHEALAVGADSVRTLPSPEFKQQPVVRELKQGRQVVHHDTRLLADDPDLQQLLRLYGDVHAQVVTPILLHGQLVAVLSVHQLDRARIWTQQEVELCRAVADAIGTLL